MKTRHPSLSAMKLFAVSTVLLALAAGCVTRREARTYTFESTGHAGKKHVFAADSSTQTVHQPVAVTETRAVQSEAISANHFDLRTQLVEVTKHSPATASVGQTLENTIEVNPLAHVGDVVLTHYVAANAEFVKSDPPPMSVSGQKLVWSWNELERGDRRVIKVWTRPMAEGSLRSCSTIHALPFGCVVTKVGKPSLSVEKSGPAIASLGDRVTYDIVVRNTGTSIAERVEVKDTIPPGMSHESGKRELVFDAGDLKPGDAKQATVTLTANERGEHVNVVTASSPNAGSASAKAITKVVQPGLKIVKTGPPQQFLGKTANYEIKASNIGDTTLTGVTVTDQAPPSTTIDGAPGAVVSGNNATWTVGTLESGASKSFTLGLRATEAGVTANTATVSSAEGLSDRAEAKTLWRGFAAVLVEMVDSPDPLLVGESTTYTLKVTNQGTAADRDVSIVVNFPPQISPTDVAGATQGTITGNRVVFAPLASIGPKQEAIWTIKAKAAAVGDGRVAAEITTELLKGRPVTEVEATQVY